MAGKVFGRPQRKDMPVVVNFYGYFRRVKFQRSLIERIERLEEEKAAIASDIRDIFAEAKGAGFDVKIMRTILKLRKMNAADRDEQEILLETYRKALDM